MPIDPLDPRKHVREWLMQLSSLTQKNLEITDMAAKIDLIADMLIAKVPIDLFTAESLEFCARRIKFMTYADIWARLQAWQRERPKTLLALPSVGAEPDPGDDTLTADDRMQIKVFRERRAVGFPRTDEMKDGKIDPLRAPPTHGFGFDRRLTVALDIQRRYNPNVFQWLINNDNELAMIAVRRGWDVPADHDYVAALKTEGEQLTEADMRHSLELLATVPAGPLADSLLSMLRTRTKKYAPHLLPLIPASMAPAERPRTVAEQQAELARLDPIAAAAAERVAAWEAQHGRKLGALTPEQLAALRDADPLVTATRAMQKSVDRPWLPDE
jgi:hypothetical protein